MLVSISNSAAWSAWSFVLIFKFHLFPDFNYSVNSYLSIFKKNIVISSSIILADEYQTKAEVNILKYQILRYAIWFEIPIIYTCLILFRWYF